MFTCKDGIMPHSHQQKSVLENCERELYIDSNYLITNFQLLTLMLTNTSFSKWCLEAGFILRKKIQTFLQNNFESYFSLGVNGVGIW